MQLATRVALVTGAGRRIGRAIALALGARQMRIAVHYYASPDGGDETVAAIRAKGSEGFAIRADLSDAEEARRLPARVAEHFGGLDVLINSAGIMTQATVEETTPAMWDEVMHVNLRAPFFVSQGALPYLRAARGRIINLADVGGLEPWPRYVAHSISKAGVVMLTQSLARAFAPEVTVNGVAPGAVLPPDDWDEASRAHLARTTPLRRLGQPDDVTAAVLYLLESGDYVTGQTIVVDGGRLIR
jgi:NAD(P)-dependent dehydrogenase (short-subunit alcohol dehydrogenase family)